MDIGVYCVHPLVRLFGMPEKIEGASVFLENGVDGMGTILAQYPGWQAVLQYSKITSGYTESEVQEKTGVCRSIGSQIQEKLRYMSVLGAEM